MSSVHELLIMRCETEEQLKDVQQLRHIVLDPARAREEELTIHATDLDPQNFVMGGYAGMVLAATATFIRQPENQIYEVHNVATRSELRRHGYGRLVLLAGEELAVKAGATGFTLDSRWDTRRFYQRLGYQSTGREITHSDGIPNFTMVKRVIKS